MEENKRKNIVFAGFVIAVIWGFFNLYPTDKKEIKKQRSLALKGMQPKKK